MALATSFTYIQFTPSTNWVVTHNLNTLTPVVQVYDTASDLFTPDNVQSIDNNTVVITLTTSMAGSVLVLSNASSTTNGTPTSAFTHIQNIATNNWVVTHNLNTHTPVVQVYDATANLFVPDNVQAIDANTVIIQHTTNLTGSALVISGNFSTSSSIGSFGNNATIAALVEKIKCRMGSGLMCVELTDAHYHCAIQEALDMYRTHADNSTKQGWMFIEAKTRQRIYRLHSYVIDISRISRMGSALSYNGFSGISHGLNNYLVPFLQGGAPFDILTHHLQQSFLETLNTVTAGEIAFLMHSGLNGSQLGYDSIALGSGDTDADEIPDTRPTGGTNIDSVVGTDTPTKEMEFQNRERLDGPVLEILSLPLQDEFLLCEVEFGRSDAELITDMDAKQWIFQYAVATSGIILGQAYRKFGSIPGPNSQLTLPGNELIAEGREKLKDLEDDLFDFKYGGGYYGIMLG